MDRFGAAGSAGTHAGTTLIPGHSRQNHSHPARVGNAGKHQSGTDEGGDPDQIGMDGKGQDHTEQDEGACRNSDLALKGDGFLAANNRNACLNAGQGSPFDVDNIGEAGLGELVAGLLSATA